MLMRREHERMSGAASAVLGGIFVIAGLAHATDGFTENVSRAQPSAILALVAGVGLLIAAFGLLSNRYWGWKAGVGAHVVAIVAVLISIFSVMAGYGDDRPSLAIPGVMLVLLVLSFVALWRSRPRNPIRRMQHEVAAKLY
jgi:peptidoglycan/LPS O-acetylase OafA/YrhL